MDPGPPAPPPGFLGRGAAGGFWRAALFCWAVMLGFLLVAAVTTVVDPQSWAPLAWYGFALVALWMAMLAWAAAASAAAVGAGALPTPVLALGALVFAAGVYFSAASLAVTGTPVMVAIVLACSCIGLVASLKVLLLPSRATAA